MVEEAVVDDVDLRVELPAAAFEVRVDAVALPADVDDGVLGGGGFDRARVDLTGALAGVHERIAAARGVHYVGHPVPGGHRRVRPLLTVDDRAVLRRSLSNLVDALAALRLQFGSGFGEADGVADFRERREDVVERRRLDVVDVEAAVAEVVADLALEGVAGEDYVRAEVGHRLEVGVQPAADHGGVDISGMCGDADETVATAEGGNGSGGARCERDDAHVRGFVPRGKNRRGRDSPRRNSATVKCVLSQPIGYDSPGFSGDFTLMTDARMRSREQERTDEEETTDGCPECGGLVVQDEEHGESVCADCGLVVEEDGIDRGPEWRAFDSKEKDEKSRVGAPTTNTMHDKGLSTNIDWRDKDAYGNSLSSNQRQKMQRLRKWNERFRTRDAKERNLKQALGEIDRMASALGLPDNVRETASVIYRRALEDDLLPGRSIEGVATSCVYAAARQAGVPRSLDEIADVSRVEKSEIARTYRYVVRELGLEVAPADPESYVPRFASSLELSDESAHRARELLKTAKDKGVHSGKSPVGLAAAAVYAAALLTNEKTTQAKVSEVADISEVTIRNRYHELLEAEDTIPV